MKILTVSSSDSQGGAARAAYRLHLSLQQQTDVQSLMLVQSKGSDDLTITGPTTNQEKIAALVQPIVDYIPAFLYHRTTNAPFSVGWSPLSGFARKINSSDADLVHLHWICGGMHRIQDLQLIKKPIVWTLHDMWPFTGGCHYDNNCTRYLSKCGQCPVLGSTNKYDISSKLLSVKKETFSKTKNLTIVGVSQWISECARKSPLLGSKKIVTLPNPINTDFFAPVDRTIARKLLNLPLDKKLVLFGAIKATNDKRKGYAELINGLQQLNIENDFDLAVFGSSHSNIQPGSGPKTHYLGHLYDDLSLRLLYSAADVMVVPSIQEAFGQTATESMSCGTPVVAFAATGLLDIVDHQLNGYLATPFDPQDLAEGIRWVLDPTNHPNLSTNARKKAVSCFNSTIVANQYVQLYEQILNQKSTTA